MSSHSSPCSSSRRLKEFVDKTENILSYRGSDSLLILAAKTSVTILAYSNIPEEPLNESRRQLLFNQMIESSGNQLTAKTESEVSEEEGEEENDDTLIMELEQISGSGGPPTDPDADNSFDGLAEDMEEASKDHKNNNETRKEREEREEDPQRDAKIRVETEVMTGIDHKDYCSEEYFLGSNAKYNLFNCLIEEYIERLKLPIPLEQ